MNQNNIDRLLDQWEETYKKGLLSFWLLLLLAQRRAYPYEIKGAISELSQNTINADENSIYRALNRLAQSGIVDSEVQSSLTGPSRRYFFLTDLGKELLTRFITRNILVYQQPVIADLIQHTISPERQ
jgi:PadR family transcriptional regulator, regulatory protein PadR